MNSYFRKCFLYPTQCMKPSLMEEFIKYSKNIATSSVKRLKPHITIQWTGTKKHEQREKLAALIIVSDITAE